MVGLISLHTLNYAALIGSTMIYSFLTAIHIKYMHQYDTWVDINLAALKHNLDIIRQRIPHTTDIIAVIKGNAYGHDAAIIAQELCRLGVQRLAVASINEGIELRQAGLTNCSIHILGSLHPDCAERAAAYDFIHTICTYEAAEALLRYKNHPVVQINIDLGMNRVGCEPHELDNFIKHIEQRGVIVEGVFGHLPDVLGDGQETDRQIQLFRHLTDPYQGRYLRHLANSPGLFRDSGAQCKIPFDCIRIGGALYGNVQPDLHKESDTLRRLLSWKAKPTRVQQVYKGESIGYASAYIADQDCWIATLPVGFVDGVPFQFSSHLQGGVVKMGRHYCNIVGKICMDHLMVKIPHKVVLSTEFEIISDYPDTRIDVVNIAQQFKTNTTDILSRIHPRVKRCTLR